MYDHQSHHKHILKMPEIATRENQILKISSGSMPKIPGYTADVVEPYLSLFYVNGFLPYKKQVNTVLVFTSFHVKLFSFAHTKKTYKYRQNHFIHCHSQN